MGLAFEIFNGKHFTLVT